MDIKILPVIAETPEFLVVEKPSGLLAHGSPGIEKAEDSLTDILTKQYPELASLGSPDRPALVHRLDKDVSGLLVVPRSEASFENLSRQFRERTIEKTYLALVHGVVARDEGTIAFPIGRSKNKARMAARSEGQEGKNAVTTFVTLERFVGATLLEVHIETGRTHQIRAHLFAYNHPVIGDPLYVPKKKKLKRDPGRIFLHATKLAFLDLSGARQEFQAPLPQDLQQFLNALPRIS